MAPPKYYASAEERRLASAEQCRRRGLAWIAQGRCFRCGRKCFRKKTTDGRISIYRSCKRCRDRGKRWWKDNPDHVRRLQKEQRARLRKLVFGAYGGPVCACCGERHDEFLTLDHINGGGNEHRRGIRNGRAVHQMYRWIIKNDYPPGFRVLCMNCNFSHGMHGYCPHRRKRSDG